jgi:hypothetical protein
MTKRIGYPGAKTDFTWGGLGRAMSGFAFYKILLSSTERKRRGWLKTNAEISIEATHSTHNDLQVRGG